MSATKRVYTDINDYVSTFSEEERERLAVAEAELDLALLLHRARQERGLSQAAAARQAGLHQQAVSRIERPDANLTVETLRKYLESLGFTVEITLKDAKTRKRFGHITLAPSKGAKTSRGVGRRRLRRYKAPQVS